MEDLILRHGSTKVYETTLENASKITSIRRDGNTTRLIDNAIQILFSGKVCICLDHHDKWIPTLEYVKKNAKTL